MARGKGEKYGQKIEQLSIFRVAGEPRPDRENVGLLDHGPGLVVHHHCAKGEVLRTDHLEVLEIVRRGARSGCHSPRPQRQPRSHSGAARPTSRRQPRGLAGCRGYGAAGVGRTAPVVSADATVAVESLTDDALRIDEVYERLGGGAAGGMARKNRNEMD